MKTVLYHGNDKSFSRFYFKLIFIVYELRVFFFSFILFFFYNNLFSYKKNEIFANTNTA